MAEKMKVIVCIDDEKIILESLKSQLLRNFGAAFKYEFAESAEEGKTVVEDLMAEGDELHSVICDWLMPGMKGDEFLYWVAKQSPECDKILLTGHVDNDVAKRYYCWLPYIKN